MSYRDAPCSIIIVGASGDLSKRKLLPALYSLFVHDQLPTECAIFGFARSEMSDQEFQALVREKVGDEPRVAEFATLCRYVQGHYDSCEDFERLREIVHEAMPGANTLFYMAIPPSIFVQTAKAIGAHWDDNDNAWLRVVLEKPFGRDSRSSAELNEAMASIFDEEQIYRIDHYLGKEVIQNLMVIRFANRIFEPIWNREHIESISISWSEEIGCEGRAGYFDNYGIIRDVLQNHLLQIVALVGMEQPLRLDAEHICDEKVKMLCGLAPAALEDTLVGQYVGYAEEDGVPAKSRTETYARTTLHGTNPRWHGVPFHLEAGKALSGSRTEIVIQFRDVPYSIYSKHGSTANRLVIRVQPDEAIELYITNKRPGHARSLAEVKLDLLYREEFDEVVPEAYERLLLEVVRGDRSLFIRDDELAVAWDLVTPLLDELDAKGVKPKPYWFGSTGPE
jgi:glucose-6-phosphate 1-dehydrogenase